MWQAKINQVYASDTEGIACVEIEYFNDKKNKIVTERVADIDTIKGIVQSGINSLTKIDSCQTLIDNPPLGIVDLTPPVPTPEEIQTQQEMVKILKLTDLKNQLEIGYLTQEEYDTKFVEVNS